MGSKAYKTQYYIGIYIDNLIFSLPQVYQNIIADEGTIVIHLSLLFPLFLVMNVNVTQKMCTHFGNLFLKIRTMMIMIQSGPAKVSYLAPLASFLSLGRLFMCPKVQILPVLQHGSMVGCSDCCLAGIVGMLPCYNVRDKVF